MRKIKVLFCIDSLTNGGAEKLLVEYLKIIDYNLFDVTLIVIYDYGVYFDDLPKKIRWKVLSKSTRDSDLYEKELFDVEVAFLESQAVNYIAHRKTNATKIAWIHTDLENNNWCKHFFGTRENQQNCYSKMDRLVFVSEYCKRQFLNIFSYPERKMIVLPNQVDKERIIYLSQNTVLHKDKFTICSIGRLIPEKRFDLLLDCVANLVHQKYNFETWILGEGPEYEKLIDKIAKLGIEDSVKLKGFIKNPYPYMKCADVIVSTSDVEGAPLVLCEALCLNKPIVATHSGGADEVLGNGAYGRLVDGNETAICDTLRDLMTNPSLRSDMSKKILERKKIVDIHKFTDKIHGILLTCAELTTKSNPGMMGLMKKVISLYSLYDKTQRECYKLHAGRLLDKVLGKCNSETPWCYGNGLCGVGVGIEYLLQKGFLEGDADEILADMDEVVFSVIFERTPCDLSLENGVLGLACYLYYRIRYRVEAEDLTILNLKENTIYLIDWIADLFDKDSKRNYYEIYYILALLSDLNIFNAKTGKIMDKCRENILLLV